MVVMLHLSARFSGRIYSHRHELTTIGGRAQLKVFSEKRGNCSQYMHYYFILDTH